MKAFTYERAQTAEAAAKAAFNQFRNDPEWVATRKASEVKGGGSLTTSVESIFMWPTDYSKAR